MAIRKSMAKSQPTPKPTSTLKKTTKKVTVVKPKNAKAAPDRSTRPMPGYGKDTRYIG